MQSEAKLVLVDCDPGVDDALALAWLAAQERAGRCRVPMITTVAGNVSGQQTAHNAVQVAESVGLDCAVHAGCDRPIVRPPFVRAAHVHGGDGLCGLADSRVPEPDSRDGVIELVETIRGLADEGRASVLLALGPLTNVAAALTIEPALPTMVERLVVMGGAFGPVKGNATPWAEFNFASDPEAARLVCHAGFAMTLVPLDVTHQVLFTAYDVAAFDGRNAAPFVVDLLDAMLGRNRDVGEPEGSYVHDALAAVAVLRPDLVATEHRVVDVLTHDPEAGHSIARRRHPTDPADTSGLEVALDVDAEAVKSLLLETLQGRLD